MCKLKCCTQWPQVQVTFSLLLQSCIVVEVPPYHSKTVGSAVQVQFYVCNGKRKRSQSQRFTYLSGKKSRSHLFLGIRCSAGCLLFFFFTPAIKRTSLFWLTRLLSTCQFKASLTPFLSCTFFFVVCRGVFHQQYHWHLPAVCFLTPPPTHALKLKWFYDISLLLARKMLYYTLAKTASCGLLKKAVATWGNLLLNWYFPPRLLLKISPWHDSIFERFCLLFFFTCKPSQTESACRRTILTCERLVQNISTESFTAAPVHSRRFAPPNTSTSALQARPLVSMRWFLFSPSTRRGGQSEQSGGKRSRAPLRWVAVDDKKAVPALHFEVRFS